MFKFVNTLEESFKEILRNNEISVTKSNEQSLKSWNEEYCEIEIRDPNDELEGCLTLKISLLELSDTYIRGEIVETWYWDDEFNPELVISLFLGADRDVEIYFEKNSNEGILKSEYQSTVIT